MENLVRELCALPSHICYYSVPWFVLPLTLGWFGLSRSWLNLGLFLQWMCKNQSFHCMCPACSCSWDLPVRFTHGTQWMVKWQITWYTSIVLQYSYAALLLWTNNSQQPPGLYNMQDRCRMEDVCHDNQCRKWMNQSNVFGDETETGCLSKVHVFGIFPRVHFTHVSSDRLKFPIPWCTAPAAAEMPGWVTVWSWMLYLRRQR